MLITNKHYRQNLKNKKRIVIKVGSSRTRKPEDRSAGNWSSWCRVLCDLRNQERMWYLFHPVPLVWGEKPLDLNERPKELAQKQACASVGQGMLMMIYQKLFNEYNM